MTALQLSEEQRKKLLEMSVALFPENHNPTIQKDNGFLNYATKTDFYKDRIHWFEACWKILNSLIEKLKLSPITAQKEISTFGIICFNSSIVVHPVDYLYEQFLKINSNPTK